MALALVRDLRERRAPASEEELVDFEIDLLAGFVLARASAGLADSTIRNDTNHLELIRAWFARPLWEMQPPDADAYFGKVLRDAKPSTRTGRAAALAVYFQFLELRHKVELHGITGRVVECPLDEMNRPRGSVDPQLRIPPAEAEVDQLFAGWRGQLATCRKFAPAARNYAVARLAADVGLRINEVRMLDLDDVRWELGRFGKLNVRHGKGSRRKGPKPRLVPLINGADRGLRWFVEDVWGHFDADHTWAGAPLLAVIPVGSRELKGRQREPKGPPPVLAVVDPWVRPTAGSPRRGGPKAGITQHTRKGTAQLSALGSGDCSERKSASARAREIPPQIVTSSPAVVASPAATSATPAAAASTAQRTLLPAFTRVGRAGASDSGYRRSPSVAADGTTRVMTTVRVGTEGSCFGACFAMRVSPRRSCRGGTVVQPAAPRLPPGVRSGGTPTPHSCLGPASTKQETGDRAHMGGIPADD